MIPDELDAVLSDRPDLNPFEEALIAALRESWAEQSRLINESSAWLAGADYARVQFSAERDEARAQEAWLASEVERLTMLNGMEAQRYSGLVAELEAEVERLRGAFAPLTEWGRLDEERAKAEAAIARVRAVCESDWLNIEMPDLWDGRRLVVLVDDIIDAIEPVDGDM